MKKYRIEQFEKTENYSVKGYLDFRCEEGEEAVISFIKNEYYPEDIDTVTIGTFDNLSDAEEALKDKKCIVRDYGNRTEIDLTYIEEIEINDDDEIEEYNTLSYADFVVF